MDLLKSELISGGVINDKNILKGAADISSLQFANEILQEHCDKIREKFSKLVTERGSTKIKVRNGDLPEVTNGRQSYVDERDFRAIMDELSSRMRKRTFYSVKIDNEKFITETAATLNNEFADKSITLNYDLGIGKIVVEKDKKFGVHGGLTDQVREDADEIIPKSDYEVVNFIMYHTNLPRLAIVRILQLFTRRDLLNSQDWLDRVTYRIAELFT
ncbi:MAG: hypothetical protein LBH18_02415, partial [Spirochaetaceae bacterium]|nr:hypothetical protein [Spirochaetaceae bacterium]